MNVSFGCVKRTGLCGESSAVKVFEQSPNPGLITCGG